MLRSTFTIFILVLAAASTLEASAAPGMIYPKVCQEEGADFGGAGRIVFVAEGGAMGLSCSQLKATMKAGPIIGMSLLPLNMVMSLPGVREEVAADLAFYGVGAAAAVSPAVIGVTMIAGVGLVTVYFVMQQSLEECENMERQQLRDEILRDLRGAYPGTSGGENIKIEIKR